MKFVDMLGNSLAEGDLVTLAPGAVVGQIVKTESGLGAPNTPQANPAVYVQVLLPVFAAPTGQVGGVVKCARPDAAPQISQ
jgi:hypothetical protein